MFFTENKSLLRRKLQYILKQNSDVLIRFRENGAGSRKIFVGKPKHVVFLHLFLNTTTDEFLHKKQKILIQKFDAIIHFQANDG